MYQHRMDIVLYMCVNIVLGNGRADACCILASTNIEAVSSAAVHKMVASSIDGLIGM